MDKETAESRLRLMAFHIAYETIYAQTADRSARFMKALIYSVQPIQNRPLVDAWYQWSNGRSIKSLLNMQIEPPAIVRPIVEA